MGRLAVVLSIVGLLATSFVAEAQRAIPDDNLAYPVLVQRADGSGSGFFLTTGSALYLVTAKHVLFDSTGRVRSPWLDLLSYPRDPKSPGINRIRVDLAALSQAGEVKAHAREDAAVVRVGTWPSGSDQSNIQFTLISGVESREMSPSGIVMASLQTLKTFDEVLVGNEVIVFGYPVSLGLQSSPQLDPLRPLLRGGIIAGLNPSTKSVIIDCPAYPGNSGGPVLQVIREIGLSRLGIIGMVREFVPFQETLVVLPHGYRNMNITNSGYSIVTPVDFVLELLK